MEFEHFEHKKIGAFDLIKPDDLLQKHMEAFLTSMKVDTSAPTQIWYAHAIYAAKDAGWIKDISIDVDKIPEMKPSHVRWFGQKIFELYVKAVEIPPN